MTPDIELIIDTQNDRIALSLKQQREQQPPVLRESDRLSLSLCCPVDFGQPTLAIQGHVPEEPDSFPAGDGMLVWRWREDRYFHNCFGLATLRVDFQAPGRVWEFPPVEVLASKLMAGEAQQMLEYLASCSPDLLYACFARTARLSGWGADSPSVERVLTTAEAALDAVERLLFSSVNRMRTRLTEVRAIKRLGPGDIMDDRSIHYLARNLDTLTPIPGRGAVAVPLRGKMLYAEQVEVARKTESTNVYENGVIHGLLRSVDARLIALQQHLNLIMAAIESHAVRGEQGDNGYARFQSVCGYFIQQVSREPLQRLAGLRSRAARCRSRALQVIPAKAVNQAPRWTPFFTANAHYRPIYHTALAWYQMGDGLADHSDLLLGLKTLDRLYEYVCLFKLLDQFATEGWQLQTAEQMGRKDALSESIADRYTLIHPRFGQMELRYEASIPTWGSGESLWGRVKVTGDRAQGYRPDFVVRITGPDGRELAAAVLDAKYSTRFTIQREHLPGLVLKYLHGTRLAEAPGEMPFDHLWALGPIDYPVSNYHWQYKGAVPVRPSIGIIQVRPADQGQGLEKWYRELLLPQLLS